MSALVSQRPGSEAIASKGWLSAHKWLLARRTSQASLLLLFLLGPWFGIWLVKGNLNFSYTLELLPLTDLFVLLQSIAAGHVPESRAVVGAGIVVALYVLVGGRVFCSWVCPINPLTDAAAWLRSRMGTKGSAHVSRQVRYWLFGASLLVSAITGAIAWELVNPISMLHRGLLFGIGLGGIVVLAIILFDLLVMRHGWCGHLCPVGACYALLGRASVLRVQLPAREACNDCMDCYAVCPEQQVIRPALKAVGGSPPVILGAECTNCGRCIDVCSKDVFAFGARFMPTTLATAPIAKE